LVIKETKEKTNNLKENKKKRKKKPPEKTNFQITCSNSRPYLLGD